MIRYTIRRLRRMPVPAVGMLLFAAILAMVLGGLQKVNDAELAKYKETCDAIAVDFAVSNLSGTQSTNLQIPQLLADVFTPGGGLSRFVSDLQRVCAHGITGQNSSYMLVGIVSTALSPELWPENGCEIQWNEGYDEGVFAGDEPVCLVPDTMAVSGEEAGEAYAELDFVYWGTDPATEYSCKLRVIGTYQGGYGNSVYCPFTVCQQVYGELKQPVVLQAIRATLQNNDDLPQLRKESKRWFAEPNPLGEPTPWGENGQQYYPFALDINDDLLQRASAVLRNSITVNRICAVLVLCLSAAAGLLIGFLMVRGRKREIALLRTMGTPDRAIYLGFVSEQMVCFCLGILLGGAGNRWDPAWQMGVLAAAFFIGLLAALLIFLRKNLLITIKEDD